MDSLFRRYYIPRLVIREVRLSDEETKSEIIDGQQRITTVQDFFNNKYQLPKSLKDVDEELAGAYYKDLSPDIRRFIDKSLKYQADIIKNIEKPQDIKDQIIATEIFWRLQQGETLNYMEVAHAQLSSLTRNFIVKHSDDQTFDYENYQPIDMNPNKHKFFSLLNVENKRMKHLQLMTRFLLIEQGNGYADLSDKKIEEFIERYKKNDGIGNYNFEQEPEAIAVLKNLRMFYKVFKDDTMLDENSNIKELSVEYFIISFYILVRHLHMHYVINDRMQSTIREFLYYFHQRWKLNDEETDNNILIFRNSRQQGENELEKRDIILRQTFFEYLDEKDIALIDKDEKRAFSEHERIVIYRQGNGLCQECLRKGKPTKEAQVSWSNFQADHVLPHSKGGRTVIENGELLCEYHNQAKSNKTPEET